MGETDLTPNENVYPPASFLNSKWWAETQIADSLTVAAAFGYPTFLLL
jgi:hypothetical protein